VLAWLPEHLGESAWISAAAEAGIAIEGLGPRRFGSGRGGIIFGYGSISETAIEPGVRALATAIASTREGTPLPRRTTQDPRLLHPT
jgi:DNA-binding transcriptional MocR family regulator